MASNRLGSLLKARRQEAGLSQADVANLVPGLSRSALNSIEGGATKTASAAMANELVKVLPVTMADLVRSMGFDLPTLQTPLPEGLMGELEGASEIELESVRALLLGFRAQRRSSARQEE